MINVKNFLKVKFCVAEVLYAKAKKYYRQRLKQMTNVKQIFRTPITYKELLSLMYYKCLVT